MRSAGSATANGIDGLTLFDIVALALLFVSGLFGFFRGAVREMVTVLAFVLAAMAAAFGLRFSGPVMRKLMEPDWTGNVAAVVIVFVVAYVALRLAGGGFARRVQASSTLGGLDRTIGLGFGLVRAIVVLAAFTLMFNYATPPERIPAWMSNAALYPLTTRVGEVLKAFAPKGMDMAGRLKPAIEGAVSEGLDDRRAPGAGYDARQRGRLDDLVENSR